MRYTRRFLIICAAGVGLFAAMRSRESIRSALRSFWGKARGGYSVEERLEQVGRKVEKRLKPAFAATGLRYPASDIAFLAFRDSKLLEVYAREAGQGWRFIKAYPVLAASGRLGPKLREGDGQVPEGVYRLELLNPNSRFYLSVRLNYPNEFDRRMAREDGRTNLGGDIMIHGSSVSVGCLAMGDDAAEDLFVLSALVGKEHVRVVISPTDFRKGVLENSVSKPPWVQDIYGTIRQELGQFQRGSRI